jgi:hypothetical protein
LINPISWKTNKKLVSAEKNLGSVYVNDDGAMTREERIADAKISRERGTIICSTADREKWSSKAASRAYFPIGVLHENDITLYYYSLRENAENRVKQYFKKQSVR